MEAKGHVNAKGGRRGGIAFGAPGFRLVLLFFAFGNCVLAAAAQEVRRPPFMKLRQDEDWSFLRDPVRRTDPFDFLKFVPLNEAASNYASLGGEIRERYEFTNNPAWGSDPQDKNGVFLQRYVLHGDLHFGPNIRFFGQLSSALETGRAGPGAPPDQNELDLQQAFVDLSTHLMGDSQLSFRFGRQEMIYGSSRLIDAREGPNVRRKFDGGRIRFTAGEWRVDALAVHPVTDRKGVFDDAMDPKRTLWGVYAVGAPAWMPAGSIDLYYLGFRDPAAAYVQGTARETRHTLGARLWGNVAPWDWNVEILYQWGTFGRADIRAWSVASEIGRSWHELPFRPRLALSTNIASGDRNPSDGRLGTLNPLFPRGNYFDELGLLGPRNFYNVHPFITIWPRDDLSITTDWDFFWRLETGDGIYSPSGRILRRPNGSDARFVGIVGTVSVSWQINSHLAFTGIYTHFFPGQFIRDTGPAKSIDFVQVTLKFQY